MYSFYLISISFIIWYLIYITFVNKYRRKLYCSTVHTLSVFHTISFIEDINSNIFAHKTRKGAHFGTRFLLL